MDRFVAWARGLLLLRIDHDHEIHLKRMQSMRIVVRFIINVDHVPVIAAPNV